MPWRSWPAVAPSPRMRRLFSSLYSCVRRLRKRAAERRIDPSKFDPALSLTLDHVVSRLDEVVAPERHRLQLRALETARADAASRGVEYPRPYQDLYERLTLDRAEPPRG